MALQVEHSYFSNCDSNSYNFNIGFSISRSSFVDGQGSPLVDAVHSAMTANPGGVVTTCSLGKDQAAATVSSFQMAAQMFWGLATCINE